jgi:hypothetical protein
MKQPLKPLRGECRVCSGVTVVTNSRVFSTREAAGASSARHSLRPLNSESDTFLQISRKTCREIAKLCLERHRCNSVDISHNAGADIRLSHRYINRARHVRAFAVGMD